MVKVELFVLAGFLAGAPVGALVLLGVQKVLRHVKASAKRVRIGEALTETGTEELIEELSKRDLVNDIKNRKRNA